MLRKVLYATLVLLATGMLLSTGSFTAMSADRSADMAVADDNDAFLGYDLSCEAGAVSVTLTNQFGYELTSGSVSVGDNEKATGPITDQTTVSFDQFEPGDAVEVQVSGPGRSVTLTRSVPTDCPVSDISGVRFTGARAGNLFIERTTSSPRMVTFTYWLLEDGTLQNETAQVYSTSHRINLQRALSGVGPDGFAAVYLESTNTTYVHQALEYENGAWSIPVGTGSNQPTDRLCDGAVDFHKSPDEIDCWPP